MPVDHKHKLYTENLPLWKACRAVTGGARKVKAADAGAQSMMDLSGMESIPGTGLARPRDPSERQQNVYDQSYLLPPLSGHIGNPRAYAQYLSYAHFFPGASRALDGFAGLLNQDQATVTTPDAMKPFTDDVAGMDAPVTAEEFVAEVIVEILTTGRAGVLTDYPERPVETPVPSVATAEKKKLKPRWKMFTAEDIWDWHEEKIDGRMVLTSVTLHEEREEIDPSAKDSEDEVTSWQDYVQWRILDRAVPTAEAVAGLKGTGLPDDLMEDKKVYRSRIFRYDEGKGTFYRESTSWPRLNGKLIAEIPFEFIGCRTHGTSIDKPPLADAVDVNLGHYRNSAAHEHGLLFTANPMAWLFGYDPDKEEDQGEDSQKVVPKASLKWRFGSSEILVLKSELAKIGVLSASAADLSALMAAMQAKRDELVTIVGSLLAQEKKAAEAARTEEIRRQGEKGVLTALARVVSAAMTRCLTRARDWMVVTGDVLVDVSTEFFERDLTAADALSVAKLWIEYGLLAKSDVRALLKGGGIIAPEREDKDIDAEIALDAPPVIEPAAVELLPGDLKAIQDPTAPKPSGSQPAPEFTGGKAGSGSLGAKGAGL
jgi:hypothetical protein